MVLHSRPWGTCLVEDTGESWCLRRTRTSTTMHGDLTHCWTTFGQVIDCLWCTMVPARRGLRRPVGSRTIALLDVIYVSVGRTQANTTAENAISVSVPLSHCR